MWPSVILCCAGAASWCLPCWSCAGTINRKILGWDLFFLGWFWFDLASRWAWQRRGRGWSMKIWCKRWVTELKCSLAACWLFFVVAKLTFMFLQQATTMPPRVGQSSRTPGRDNMGQEEVKRIIICFKHWERFFCNWKLSYCFCSCFLLHWKMSMPYYRLPEQPVVWKEWRWRWTQLALTSLVDPVPARCLIKV